MIKLVIAGVLLAAGIGFFVWHSTQQSAEYYQTIQQMRQDPQSGAVRVVGVIQPNIERRGGNTTVDFWMKDGASKMEVRYTGTLPSIFQPGIQAVVQGRPDSQGVFQATELQTKCPSHFSASPSPGAAPNPST
ncbi:MAG: cytochrome c maturation protein CcmE [Candidatus Dormibacteraceae bacterium]